MSKFVNQEVSGLVFFKFLLLFLFYANNENPDQPLRPDLSLHYLQPFLLSLTGLKWLKFSVYFVFSYLHISRTSVS